MYYSRARLRRATVHVLRLMGRRAQRSRCVLPSWGVRVLITGATGFLGGAVAERLARAHEVVATGRNRAVGARLEALGVVFEPADLCDRSRVLSIAEGADAVVHCAALSSPWGPSEAFERANVVATESILDACLEHAVPRLVHISTPSVYMGAGDRR